MPQDNLNEREFELINIVGAKVSTNQRDLSQHMDLSLGMVNMLIRRLISKGYIRIKQLNKRKVEYLLTPKGFSEKMRKSVKYALKTINSIGSIRNCLKGVLSDVIEEGKRDFYILGESDFAVLVEMTLKELCSDIYRLIHIDEIPTEAVSGVLLICKEIDDIGPHFHEGNSVDLVKALAEQYTMVQFAGGV